MCNASTPAGLAPGPQQCFAEGPGAPPTAPARLSPPPQGFPRADIDVRAVREDRHKLICLGNDHKAVSAELDGLLGRLHALARWG
jgi:26S proteasome non-ATPase regulatory subunit 9